ncbi:biotin transporter BioY [Ruminococcus flavefaciens]|uniref:Biotin transporter n=1 Tax=Ruminococcus flavefaciens TaxID=1265 RepID=A0A1M7K4P5_RUMFL|nr:biotin transporter BioY [Ruminococcus flavefaciens]SHM60161.1 biotin transport system substrate-specific component [Ruminococcus flavefaciens]
MKEVIDINNANKTKNMVLTAMFTALITAGAYIRIPVPVCPFTLQFLFTTLAGIILGKNRGAAATALYVVLGLAGLPVFTGGGGIGYVLQPTFGYLIGFIAGSYITGAIAHSGKASAKRILMGCFAGLAVVYAMGMIYYYMISAVYMHEPIGLGTLFLYCFVLAVPGDIVLCILSAALAKRLMPVIHAKGTV